MPLLLLIATIISPRLGAVLLAIFTGWFSGVNWIIVILGIIFAPWTILWYAAVQNWFAGNWGIIQILILLLAIMVDFGSPYYSRSHYHVVEHAE